MIDISHDDTVVKALKKDPAHDQEEALKDIYRKLRPGDPPTVANAARSAEASVLRSEEIRSRPRRSLQDQSEARHRRRSRRTHFDRQGFHRRDQVSDQPAPRRRHARRYRSSRQPPRADGGRIARQPVPRRSRPHGASGERAHDSVRRQHRRHDAAEAHQPEGAVSAVIRDFFGRSPALAVHGSDESARGIDPQAPSLGPRARRSLARSRRLRSPRRSSVALRPHLPD